LTYTSFPNAAYFSPLFFTLVVQSVVLGALLVHGSRYFMRSAGDPWLLKAGAAFTMAWSLLQSALDMWSTWQIFAQGFGNYTRLTDVSWATNVEPLMTVNMAIPLQLLMIFRCYTLLNLKWWSVSPYLVLLGVAYISGVVDSIQLLVFFGKYHSWSTVKNPSSVSGPIWLISSAALDAATTITILLHLVRNKTQHRGNYMNQLIDRVVKLIWETALPPSLCAVIGAILYFVGNSLNPQTSFVWLWSYFFIFILGKLYALAYFMTLNFRLDERCRSEVDSHSVNLNLTALSQVGPPSEIRVNISSFKQNDDISLETGRESTPSSRQ